MSEVPAIVWSVAVVGKWNKSIVTPVYISKTLLKQADGIEFEMHVPAHLAGPVKIGDKSRGVIVSVDDDKLVIEIEKGNYKALALALEAASTAIGDLGRTPVTAAAVTLTYELSPTRRIPIGADSANFQSDISSKGYEIVRHMSGKVFAWEKSRIMFMADRESEASGMAYIAFEMRSMNSVELKIWLDTPASEFESRAEGLLALMTEGESV